MVQFIYLEGYVDIQSMIHSALCVCNQVVIAELFALISEYLDQGYRCSEFAPFLTRLSFLVRRKYYVKPW